MADMLRIVMTCVRHRQRQRETARERERERIRRKGGMVEFTIHVVAPREVTGLLFKH